METLFRFFVEHPLLPLAILLVSVLAGFLFLLRNKQFFPGEGGLAVAEPEDKAPKEFKAPHLDTHLGDAIVALDRAQIEINALNFGLASGHLANYFIEMQSVPEAARGQVIARGETLARRLKAVAESAVVADDKYRNSRA